MSELLSQEVMNNTIGQWIYIRKKIAEEKSVETLTKQFLSDVMQQLQDLLEQNITPEKIGFSFKENGEIVGWLIGGRGENVQQQVSSKKKREQIYERIKKAFADNPDLDVEEKENSHNGINSKEIFVGVKKD